MPGHLLGDSGYPRRKYLLTPVINMTRPTTEVTTTRNTIERAFGVLKRRFAHLGSTIRTKINTIKAIIVSSFVLHNIAIMTRVLLPEEVGKEEMDAVHIQ
ncbi:nuclease HARBI1-like 16 [Homarus americanus]|uniref:Nuclease HARBI1-like 16 n=1 Tax=Homarus americanus TaxID=6706 RepID=A0A8J5N8U9_HOMAM|nr:nuclease HARBI1-like 16 [Homarus americanus]